MFTKEDVIFLHFATRVKKSLWNGVLLIRALRDFFIFLDVDKNTNS